MTTTRLVPSDAEAEPPSGRSDPPPAEGGRDTSRLLPLDGLRGLSVLVIVMYHVRVGPFTGGLAAVTVFFALSGFLIMSRTVAEVDRTGGFRLGSFVERRVRRLAPASLVCLAGTLVATHLFGDAVQRSRIGGDVVASLLQVANWRFLFQDASYDQLFAGASPLNHYWTLAIEEQFYVLFPLAVALVVRARPARRPALVALVCATAASVAIGVAFTTDSFDRFYYATDTRLFELLAGVVLALLIGRGTQGSLPRSRPGRILSEGVTLAAILGLLAAAVVFKSGSMSFARGGSQLVAILTVVAIVGLRRRGSTVGAWCSVPPMVWLGTRSYAIYLFHWPIIALSPDSIGPIRGHWLAALQVALTLALASASWRFVEQPVSLRRRLPDRRGLVTSWLGAGAALGVVALVAGAVLPTSDAAYAGGDPTTFGPVSTVPTPTGADPLRVAVAGDSTAVVLANALQRYQVDHPVEIAVLPLGEVACTVTIVAKSRHYRGEDGSDMTSCNRWPATIPPAIEEFRPDVVVVVVGMMEQADQQLEGSTRWHNVLQPSWRRRQLADFERLADALGGTGAPILWADVPYMEFQEDLPWLSDDPRRTDALNALLRSLDDDRDDIELFDYAKWIGPQDGTVDTERRPDGLHLSDVAADELVTRRLVPMLLDR